MHSWIPLFPVTSGGVEIDVVPSSPLILSMILGVLETLGVEPPLGVVGLAAEFMPKVCLWL
jgi:Na+/H+ antiporter NhaA